VQEYTDHEAQKRIERLKSATNTKMATLRHNYEEKLGKLQATIDNLKSDKGKLYD
jgi:hypothetical protein